MGLLSRQANKKNAAATLAILLHVASMPCVVLATEAQQLTLTMLGTSGGPHVTSERSNPASLLDVGGKKYLIDCGIGTARRLAEAGVASTEIGVVFITHLHPDHTMGLAALLADRKFHAGNNPSLASLQVYGPAGTAKLVRTAVQYVETGFSTFAVQGVGNRRTAPYFGAQDVFPPKVYIDDSISVTAHENTHYALMESPDDSDYVSLSYRIDSHVGTIVFSGDTGPDESLAEFGSGADAFVAEVVNLEKNIQLIQQGRFGLNESFQQAMIDHMTHQHLTGEQVGQIAEDMAVKTVILNHFGPADVSTAAITANTIDVTKNFDGAVYAASDLDRFCWTRNGEGRTSLQKC